MGTKKMKNLTLKGFKIYSNKATANLIRPIYNQLGVDSVESFFETCRDIDTNGAKVGFCGFIYCNEVCDFFRKHRKDIISNLELLNEYYSCGVIEMVKNNHLLGADYYSTDEVGKALYGRFNKEYTQIYNVMVWIVLEMVANHAVMYADSLE